MGTRATIYVKTRKSTIGKSLKFNPAMLDAGMKPLDDSKYDKETRRHPPLTEDIFVESEPVTKDYLCIYDQFDGYPSNMGLLLMKHFGTYEKALNLMAGGVTEAILKDGIVYCNERRTSFNNDDGYRQATGGCSFAQHDLPSYHEAYQYLFYDGRWYVRQYDTYWYDVEQLLEAAEPLEHRYDLDNAFEGAAEILPVYAALPEYNSDETDEECELRWEASEKAHEIGDYLLPDGDNVRKMTLGQLQKSLKALD